MAGRKSKYTPELTTQLIQVLSAGATVKDACAYVGIDEATYFRWYEHKSEFRDSATRARSTGRIQAVGVIRKAIGDGDTQAAEWYLERTDPEHWGKRTYHYHQFEVFRKFCEERKLSAGDMLELYMQELAALDRIPSNGSTEGSATG